LKTIALFVVIWITNEPFQKGNNFYHRRISTAFYELNCLTTLPLKKLNNGKAIINEVSLVFADVARGKYGIGKSKNLKIASLL
jgi:hypothetical protein